MSATPSSASSSAAPPLPPPSAATAASTSIRATSANVLTSLGKSPASIESGKEGSMSPSQAAANALHSLSKSAGPSNNTSSLINAPPASRPSSDSLYANASAKAQQQTPFNTRNNASFLNQSLYSNVGPSQGNGDRIGAPAPQSPGGSGSPLRKELDVGPRNSNGSAPPSGVNTPTRPKIPASTGSATKSSGKDGSSKRKKVNRACFHCQKAHLTCDDSRPCQRCVKKGLAETCTDGFRKKAKYLLDDEELGELKRQKKEAKAAEKRLKKKAQPPTSSPAMAQPTAMEHALASTSGASNPSTSPAQDLLSREFDSGQSVASHQSEPTFELAFDASHNFGSEATSLEYSILSSMLNGTDLAILGSNGSPDFQTSPAMGILENYGEYNNGAAGGNWNASASASTGGALESILSTAGGLDGTTGVGLSSYADGSGYSVTSPAFIDAGATLSELRTGGEVGFAAMDAASPVGIKPGAEDEGRQTTADAGTSETMGEGSRSAFGEPLPDINKEIAAQRSNRQQQDTLWKSRVAKVYQANTQPFPYPRGYHFLIKYATEKFEKQDVLRIVRALAIFRPSLIALQMPLTEEDEIFVERSFQRTILEFEKLISFSGTPTVVWRRTCEICVVGAEFCMLTQWPREKLMGRYIYELMNKNSTLDYWEKFALHAFENTTQSVMTTCTLMTPQGKPVPCAWSFTIKRDVFDLPSLIVGNFLPVLS